MQPQWETWPSGVRWQPVSPRLSYALLTRLGLTGLPMLVVAAGLSWLWWGPVWAIAVGAVIVVVAGAQLILIPRRVRSWGYAERDDDLLIRHGLWTRRLSIVPYGRMQFIDIRSNPVERMFTLSTITLHTASASSDSTVPGLDPDTATGLRDRLANRAHTDVEGL